MSVADSSVVATTIGPTGFGFLVWGSIFLVVVAFGYIVWTLSMERQTN